MMIDEKLFLCESKTGKLLEFTIGLIYIFLALPLLLISIAGFFSGKLCDSLASHEDRIVRGINNRLCKRDSGKSEQPWLTWRD